MAGAPPIQKLAHFALVASDVERTQRWYTDVLGAKVLQRDENVPDCVDLAGTMIDLFPSGGVSPAGIPFNTPSPGSIGQHHAYVISLEDYDSWVAHFERLGQQYRRAAHAYTMSIYIDDPDGYHIELTVPFDDTNKGRIEMEKRGLL
jgi:catechol 2,3-dioxygenase-like lactoylglutathione lyase family enzyme